MQIKSTLNYHYTLLGMVKIKKINNNTKYRRGAGYWIRERRSDHSHIADANVKCYSLVKVGVSPETNLQLPYDLVGALSGNYSREMKNTVTEMFTAALSVMLPN